MENRLTPSTITAISIPGPSQPPSNTPAGASASPAVSDDGRYVAFESSAANVVPGQFGPLGPNIFLLDRLTGTTTLVSHMPEDAKKTATVFPGEFPELQTPPLLSGDGNFVAYVGITGLDASANNDSNSSIIIYNRLTGVNTLVSHTAASPSTPTSTVPALDGMSPNGRFIIFDVLQSDLVVNQTGSGRNLYEFNQTTQKISLVSFVPGHTNQGSTFEHIFSTPSIANNGSVAYVDAVDGLHLSNPQAGTNTIISTSNSINSLAVSDDGATLAFVSEDPNVSPDEETAFTNNVYYYSTITGAIKLVSGALGSPTQPADDVSGVIETFMRPDNYTITSPGLAISGDGSTIGFISQAGNLVPGQTGSNGNVFLYNRNSNTLALVSGVNGSTTLAAGGDASLQATYGGGGFGGGTIAADSFQAADFPPLLSLSNDGSRLAYVSQAKNLVSGQTGPGLIDTVFLFDRATHSTTIVSHSGAGAKQTLNAQSAAPFMSASGNLVTFATLAVDLVTGSFDANGAVDVYGFSVSSATNALISKAGFVQTTPGNSFLTSTNADGNLTVFTSSSNNLVPNQVTTNSHENIFLFNKATGVTTLVNHLPGLPATTGDGGIDFAFDERPARPQYPVISADGSTIAFYSTDDNLVVGQTGGSAAVFIPSVYLYDVQTGQIKLVNHVAGQPSVVGDYASSPAINANGRYVAYISGYGVGEEGGLSLYDSLNDTTLVIVPVDSNGVGTASLPSISDDGKRIAYLNQGNAYVFDLDTGTSTLASHDFSALTTPANGTCDQPVISHDGSSIAFVSRATNLVTGQSGPGSSTNNVFEYGVATGTVILVSGVNGSATQTGNDDSDSPAINADGGYIAYRSDATNLIVGQGGGGGNIFQFDRAAHTQTLVTHVAGDVTFGASGSTLGLAGQPVIDDDGHLVSFASTADDLIPGQTGPSGSGLSNVFVWLRQTNANILASGHLGSPTITGDGNSDFPLLTRDSFPSFTSTSSDLVTGLGKSSVGYINTLVNLVLAPNLLADGTLAGALVGNFSVSSLLAGQFLPPSFLPLAAVADNGSFGMGSNAGGQTLLYASPVPANSANKQSYQLVINVDVGFGNSVVTLTVNATPGLSVMINQATNQPDLTSTGLISFTAVFNAPVSDFGSGDVTLGGTAGANSAVVTGSGTTYNIAVSGMAQPGTVSVGLAAGVAHDGAGHANLASTSTDNTVTYDPEAPTVTVNQASGQADPSSNSPINFTVVFSKPVIDFTSADVKLSGSAGATIAIITGAGTTYNVAVSGMVQAGTVIATVPAGLVRTLAGAKNAASTSADNSVNYSGPAQGATGQISGRIYQDIDLNDARGSGEPGQPGQTVFLDLNNNGVPEPGEPAATTDGSGAYQFNGLVPALYTVREVQLGGVLLSTPSGGSFSVNLSNGAKVSNQDFGNVFTSITVPLTLPPDSPFQAKGSANADFVEAVYRAVLNRDADAGGLKLWTGILNNNPGARLQVVQGIRNSPEHFGQEIDAFYETLLRRRSDPAGRGHWVTELQNGVREEQIAAAFLNSPEYLSNGDKFFVDAMYQSLLGRAFDPSGERSWLDALGDDRVGNPTHPPRLTHAQVIDAFLSSTESLQRLVTGYYQVFLQRQPDLNGLNGWVAKLQQGLPFLAIGQDFVTSDEFFGKAAAHH